jgi:hypothetical protein
MLGKELVDVTHMEGKRLTCTEMSFSFQNSGLQFLLHDIIFWGFLVEELAGYPLNFYV